MKLYICFTYYHTLITMMKSINQHEKFDLLLDNGIPGFDMLKRKLIDSDQFNRIYEYDSENIKRELCYKNRLDRIINQKRKNKKIVSKFLDLDFLKYSDIYIYQDVSPIGQYLIQKKIKYHLIEDALNYYQYFNKYWNIDKKSFTHGTVKYYVKCIFGFHCWGQAMNCIDIEVNDKQDINIPKNKVIEVSRKKLMDDLNKEERKLVYRTYACKEKLQETGLKSAIIFTQPLYSDKFVDSMAKQKSVFESIIKDYVEKGYLVTIKPHPRDFLDYAPFIEKYGCNLIEKNIPSEVLNFNEDVYFDVAIAITSTSINALENVKSRRFMGRKYIEHCINED